MDFLISIGLTMVIFAVIFLLAWLKYPKAFKKIFAPANQTKWNLNKYYLKKSIMTNTEKWLYKYLIQEAPDTYVVVPQIGMKEFIGVKAGKGQQSHFRHISQKHIDFLICTKDNLSPVFGIEFDDKTHTRPDRKKRDHEVNEIYNAIGFTIIHIPTNIKEEALKTAIKNMFVTEKEEVQPR